LFDFLRAAHGFQKRRALCCLVYIRKRDRREFMLNIISGSDGRVELTGAETERGTRQAGQYKAKD